MTGGGVIEAKWASFIVVHVLDIPEVNYFRNVQCVDSDDGLDFGDFYNGALKVFEAKRTSRIGVRVLNIPQVILGCRPEVWTVHLCISAHQTMCANVILFANTAYFLQ